MIIAGQSKDLIATVHSQINSTQLASGIMWCVIRLESSGLNHNKYWDTTDSGSWESTPVLYPSGLHLEAGQWLCNLPAVATIDQAGSSIHFSFTNNLNETFATTVCGGAEYYIRADVPVIESDLKLYEMEAL